jgi:hypothetical protein
MLKSASNGYKTAMSCCKTPLCGNERYIGAADS